MNIDKICNLVKDRIREDIEGQSKEKVPQLLFELLESKNGPALLARLKKTCYWNGEETWLVSNGEIGE